MRKNNKGKMFLAILLALVMLLCSLPVGYAEDAEAEILTAATIAQAPEVAEETVEPEPEVIEVPAEEPAADPEVIEVPEEEPAADPETVEIPEEETAAEPEVTEVPEEEPETAPETAEIPEEEPAAEPEVIEVPEEEPETEPEAIEEPVEESETEEEPEEDLVEFEDEDAGFVSEELLEDFNNPDTYDTAEFSGTVEIEMKNSEIYYGRDVTLVAKVSGVEMNSRLVWEANDGDDRGWFTVGSGPEYTFTVTPEIVNREYRVSLFTVD